MPRRDLALIAIVILAWGTNFSAMKLALDHVPPFFFVGLRFAILIPLIALLPLPPIGWARLLGVGLFINMGQFAFLFAAMRADASAGLAALLLQVQAPLTILFSALFLGERLLPLQILGMGIALTGLIVIATATGGSVTLVGLGLVLCGALCWATGNMILKSLPKTQPMLPVFIWASLVPPLPMFALSALSEPHVTLWNTFATLPIEGWAAILYVALISTVLGYTLWGRLLARHPAISVTPYALLIPVVAVATAWVVLGERPTLLDWIGGAIILSGLALTQCAPLLGRIRSRQGRP